jgi:hypothetical protein
MARPSLGLVCILDATQSTNGDVIVDIKIRSSVFNNNNVGITDYSGDANIIRLTVSDNTFYGSNQATDISNNLKDIARYFVTDTNVAFGTRAIGQVPTSRLNMDNTGHVAFMTSPLPSLSSDCMASGPPPSVTVRGRLPSPPGHRHAR